LGEKLNDKEDREMDEIAHRIETLHPYLEGGTKRATSAIYEYIANDLPKVRVLEAIAIAEEIKQRAEKALEILKRSLPSDAVLDEDLLKKSQWQEIAKSSWEKSSKFAWKWRFFINSTREKLFADMTKNFKEILETLFMGVDALCHKLEDAVPYQESKIVYIDVPAIEKIERDRLISIHLEKVQELAVTLTEKIYSLLEKFTAILKGSLGLQASDNSFLLEKVMPFNVCNAQLTSMLMHYAYPVVNAIVAWPKRHQNRPGSIQQMLQACPDIKYQVAKKESEANKNSIKNENEAKGENETTKNSTKKDDQGFSRKPNN